MPNQFKANVPKSLIKSLPKSVVPNLRGEWDVLDGEKEISHHANQKNAISKATTLAEQDQAELVIYDREGRIIERKDFGSPRTDEESTTADSDPGLVRDEVNRKNRSRKHLH